MRSERVIFGSDYPLVLYPKTETAPGFGGILREVKSAGLAETQVKAVLGGNAASLFGW